MNTIRDGVIERNHPIAIIGMGCMFPQARNLTEFWRLLRLGKDAITDTPATHWGIGDYFDPDPKKPDMTYCHRGGFLLPTAFDPTEFGIPPTILEATDTSQLLGLVVAKSALEDAGYGDGREFNRERASVVLGITGLQELSLPLGARLGHPIWRRALAEAGVRVDVAAEVIARISDGYVSWQENSFPGLLGNVVAGRIANRLNLRGTNCVVDAACASSLSAVHLAMMELATGRCDMALAGGVDTLNGIFMYMCFSKTPALSPTGDARPFSDEADGTVLGEGIGMLVLKRLTDAQRDGDRIYAVIRSMGTSSDGRSQSIYAPHAAGQARALRNAYELAGVTPDTVGLIEAHGTGTKVGDAVEFEALRTVFREAQSDGAWCAVGSVKSQIGHTKAAAGAAGLIKAALALHHRALPPSIKIKAPNPKLAVEDSPFYLSSHLRPWTARGDHPRRAGVSAFGFGGSNFHAVLEEHPAAVRKPAWDGSVQIIALSADSAEALREGVEIWRVAVTAERFDYLQLPFMAQESRAAFDTEHAFRLVLVLEAGQDLGHLLDQATSKLQSAANVTDWSLPGVYFGSGRPQGCVAMLFSGQGSQYVNMGRDVACAFPEFQEAIQEVDTLRERTDEPTSAFIYPAPTFSEEVRLRHERDLTRTEIAQPALGAVELAFMRVLERFGVKPDMVAGHSYGELVALCAAGVYDAKALHLLSRLRGRLMADGDGGRGAMMAVKAPLTEIERMIAEDRLDVVLANRNGPAQGVLSGIRAEIARALDSCKRRGFAAKQLQVSGAFHSSLMDSAAGPLRNALEAVQFDSPSIPVFANSTGQAYPADASEARELLGRQLLRPVEFVSQIGNMYDAGARTYIEVGPKAVLIGLVESILEDRWHRAMAVDASQGRRGGIVDLAKLLAALAAEGRSVDLTRWERPVKRPREPKMAVPLVGANYRSPQAVRDSVDAIASTPRTSIEGAVNGDALPPLLTAARHESDGLEKSLSSPSGASERATQTPTRNGGGQSATPPESSPVLAEALRMVQDGIQAMQALQQQTAAAHQRFLEGQEQAHRVFQQMMENQQRLFAATLGLADAPSSARDSTPDTKVIPAQRPVAPAPSSSLPQVRRVSQPEASRLAPAIRATQTISSPPAPPIVMPTATPMASFDAIVLDVVCEKTGYPREMIDLNMDIEADLGIDSIKRVEIVAAVEERIPSFAGIKPEYMGSIRTLSEIVAFINSSGGPFIEAAPIDGGDALIAPSQVVVEASAFADTLIDVVSQLTGYPREMIDLTMDMEADLGIDSIKRVEILAAVEARVPEMPPVLPEYMGSLRTLQQIVEYCGGSTSAAMVTPKPSAFASLATMEVVPNKSIERRILATVELPHAEVGVIDIATGREVWVSDDGSPLAAEVVARLGANGVASRVVNLAGQYPSAANVGGLILLAPPCSDDVSTCSDDSATFLKRAFLLTKHVARELMAAAAEGGGLLATVSRMDGVFGLIGGPMDPSQGGLSGLTKTAVHEMPGARCRAIDVASTWRDHAAIAEALVHELAITTPIEIGLSKEGRRGLVLESVGRRPVAADICEQDVFVITGGARGVTAEAALALARRFRPKLLLIGRSPAPTAEPAWLASLNDEADIKQAILANEFSGAPRPKAADLQAAFQRHMANREIRGNLQRLADAGSQVLYRSVDVCDVRAVEAAMSEARAVLGPVTGLVHAAGVLEDRLIIDKTSEQFDRVFDTKVVGFRNLMEVLDPQALRHIVFFSSVSARFGNRGQADYAVANEVLNKIAAAQARQLPNCRVKSLNWGPWDGGMVGPGLKREFLRQGIELISLQAGAEAFVDELEDGSASVEVVLGAGFPEPLSAAYVKSPEAVTAPSLQSNGHMDLAFERVVDLESHPFLQSHILGGRPVLPLAITLEWLGHAAAHAQPGFTVIGFDDVRVMRGVALENGKVVLRFRTGEARRVDGQLLLDVEMRSVTVDGSEIPHATAIVALAGKRPEPPAVAYSDAVAESPYPFSPEECYQRVLFHGPHFRGIEKIDGCSSRGLIARLTAAPSPSRWMAEPLHSDWLTDPLIIDSAFQMAILWCSEELGAPSLPCRIVRYRQYRASLPRDGVTAVLEVREHSPRKMICDITLFDLDAAVVARIDGHESTVDASLREAFRPALPAAAES